ncbi:CopG family transcriptional regulator [Sphingomonas qomolangmaensis]|uniref:CopG family transcriptional regulator n=1 Tax=Sphingomonas qomolangmaensis TaxID=2918765 RepID=A0ABY5L5Z5_9SPHN|nr:CopG family transcriptional regulator [Sphingomonas qomolangmaensis]UUL82370.1 CopG family transcriptional regulator [Sphingomonas qomolangmaensis]
MNGRAPHGRRGATADDLSAKLDDLANKPGNSKTAILTEALRAWFDRKAINELDERFAPRMDRQQRILQRVENTLNITSEALDLFIQHQMTIMAHQPAFDTETAQLGRQRYQAFMDQVARRLAANQGKARLTIATNEGKRAS